ncbi:hypothetical protein BDB01DRAFT_889481 [Pilobolus umbonatus]|nr:hypothetical protein BDB01DRAFT_889481 [Pilobolus umbonatus]
MSIVCMGYKNIRDKPLQVLGMPSCKEDLYLIPQFKCRIRSDLPGTNKVSCSLCEEEENRNIDSLVNTTHRTKSRCGRTNKTCVAYTGSLKKLFNYYIIKMGFFSVLKYIKYLINRINQREVSEQDHSNTITTMLSYQPSGIDAMALSKCVEKECSAGTGEGIDELFLSVYEVYPIPESIYKIEFKVE